MNLINAFPRTQESARYRKLIIMRFRRKVHYGSQIKSLMISVVLLMMMMSRPTVVVAGGLGQWPIPPFGIEVNGAHGSEEFDRVKQAGANWTRLAGLWWPSVEPEEGKYDWTAMTWLETLFVQARNNGLTPILIIRGTPMWAQAYSGVDCGPIRPDKLPAFADFMAVIVNRYGNAKYNVRHWELGNEPDIDRNIVGSNHDIGCWGDDQDTYYGGGAYANMLKAVYPRIKQVDPQAQVLVGGLVLDCDPRPGGGCPDETRRRPARFLEGVLRAGGASYFDAVSFHSYDYYDRVPGLYSNSNWQSDSASTGPVFINKAAFIRSLLEHYGASNKRMYNTEDALLCHACVDDVGYEWTKALYASQLNISTLQSGLGASIWFRLADWPGTALIDSRMLPTRAYVSYRTATLWLTDAVVVRVLKPPELEDKGLRGVVLMRGSESMWIVWVVDGSAHQLKLPKKPSDVRDVIGNAVALTSATLTFDAPSHLLYYVRW